MGLLAFLGSVVCLSLVLVVRPRITFAILLAGLIIFQPFFLQRTLFTIGGAKVYAVDLTMASLLIALLIRFARKRVSLVPKSLRGFLLFFGWGLVATARGLPQHGYSAVGESRWYILPMFFYFFIVATVGDRQGVWQFAKWFLACVLVMIGFHFCYYYFLGGKELVPAPYWQDHRQIFRFIRAREVLLVAFALVGLLLLQVVEETKRRIGLLYSVSAVLGAVVVITQIRSVWLALAMALPLVVGSLSVRFVLRGLPIQAVLLLNASLLLIGSLGLLAPIVGREVYSSVARSVSFFENPAEDPTGSWRLMGWRQELIVAMENPILGRGLGGYSEWFDGQVWQRVAVHNGYIMVFSKFGAIGTALLGISVALWLWEMAQYAHGEEDERYRLLGYAIQVCVVMHLVFSFFFDFTIFFWILLGAGTVLVRKYRSARLAVAGSVVVRPARLAKAS
jgi:hypothetical protein